MKCDTCNGPFHYIKNEKEGGNVPLVCPLEKYKLIKDYYPEEMKGKIHQIFPGQFTTGLKTYEDIQLFSEIIPETTPLLDFLLTANNKRCGSPLIIESDIKTFFLHFHRILLEIYYIRSKEYHHIDSILIPGKDQLNYLWLSPTILRECYFGEKSKGNPSRFKSMSSLLYPSLVIYPLGQVDSIKNVSWGKTLQELISMRKEKGNPTWIVQSKKFEDCIEVKGCEDIITYLNTKIPKLTLNPDIALLDTVYKSETPPKSNNSNNLGSYL